MGFTSIDEYILCFPVPVQQTLQQMRVTIRKAAPNATEKISYQIPTFALHGNLVHFAAFKNHIGFYPGPSGIEKFKNQLNPYPLAKGSIKFPLNEELPFHLIAEIVKWRVSENCEKEKKKKGQAPL